MRHRLDEIDLEILQTLQRRGRTKRSELADQVGLTIPSVSERLRKLEELGIIRGYAALLDPKKIGLEVMAFIVVELESSRYFDPFVQRALDNDEILECHAITGEGSYLVKARTKDTSTLERLLSEIRSWPGVANTRTSIVLSSPKDTTVLPLTQLELAVKRA
ncbi:MAG: Lrp/AsnC family transcriptional regulator [candidate division KSB1 bacterium]|nr:Lrp/AsnC family transcriptional regulator [candidate division KSB1 bacterium]